MTRALAAVALFAGCDGSAIVGLECRTDRTECDGACVDLLSDPMHCGACDVACPSGVACTGGECAGENGCGEGATECVDGCADLSSDPAHCGGCDVACDPGEACQDGACVPACDPGRTDCSGACVDLSSDASNCGACGAPCGTTASCEGGTCVPIDPCPEGDCGRECAPGRTDCGGAECVDLESDPADCGACGNACAADEVCSKGACTSVCGPGLTLCDRSCVDLEFDPDHCGACDGYCDTGLCELGECLGGEIGHWVLIGHDYGHGRRDQNRIAGNAVFMAGGATVDVLVYREASDAAEVENVYAAIDQVASDVGRSTALTVYDPDSSLAEALAAADVFLVTDQEGVGVDALEAIGAAWAEDLDRFLRSGGVLVVTDGGETHAILSGAGLVDVVSTSDVSGQQLDVTAAADAVAAGMPVRYRAEETSVSYETDAAGAVVEAAGHPVVLHQVVLP